MSMEAMPADLRRAFRVGDGGDVIGRAVVSMRRNEDGMRIKLKDASAGPR